MSAVTAEQVLPSTAEPVMVEPVTAARVIRSEWIKMRSLRSTALTLLAAVATMVAMGWIFGWASNTYWADMRPDEQLSFSPIDASLAGYNLAQLAVGVLGVLLVTGEYATGMIRATFGAVPRRLPVLWAKAVVYAGVAFALMLSAAVVAFLGGQQLLGEHGTTLTAPGALRAVIGVAGYLTLIGVFAVAVGFVVRSTAGGVAFLFGLLLVMPTLGLLLPSSWQRHLLPYLPSNAGGSLFSVRTAEDALSATTSLLVLLVWVAGALASAALILNRRDA
jgi:ABC-type transport system involved in multi-copper enzyme maturation permease subunit